MTKSYELIKLIKADTVATMKSKDKARLSTLKLLIAELEKEKVSLKLEDVYKLADEEVLTVINRQVKKLDKEIEAYVAVGRDTTSQENEKKLLAEYLPTQLTDDQIAEYISFALNLTEEGKIRNPMQFLSVELKGKADMGLVSKMLKEMR